MSTLSLSRLGPSVLQFCAILVRLSEGVLFGLGFQFIAGISGVGIAFASPSKRSLKWFEQSQRER